MKTHLAILGQGAVSPAGIGVDALFGATPQAVETALVGKPEARRPVFRVDPKQPALARWQAEPRMRRASQYTLFLAEAAAQALGDLDAAARATTGLVVASSLGCLGYSRRFYEGIVSQGRKGASPALFPDTVYNSPVSHVAATLGLGRAAYALVGDETAWIDALQTASLWLRRGEAERVLVLGAEEFDPIVLDAAAATGERGRFVPSEGAGGLLVGLTGKGTAVAEIAEARSGVPYRSRRQEAAAARRCLAALDPALPLYRNAGQNRFAALERDLAADRPALPGDPLPHLGEAFSASAAWQTIRAVRAAGTASRLALPVWGLHCRVGALVLDRVPE